MELTDRLLPDPEVHPTVPVWPTAGRALGLSRKSAYLAAQRGQIPGVFKIGGRYVVATAALRRALDLHDSDGGTHAATA